MTTTKTTKELTGMEKLMIIADLMRGMGLSEDVDNMDMDKGVKIKSAVEKAIFDNL